MESSKKICGVLGLMMWMVIPSHAQPVTLPSGSVATQDQELERMYHALDAQLTARDGRRIWVPRADLSKAVTIAAPGAAVGKPACAADFCRIEVRHSNEKASRDFAKRLTENPDIPAGVIFKYDAGHPLLVVAYVLRPRANPNAMTQRPPGASPDINSPQ